MIARINSVGAVGHGWYEQVIRGETLDIKCPGFEGGTAEPYVGNVNCDSQYTEEAPGLEISLAGRRTTRPLVPIDAIHDYQLSH